MTWARTFEIMTVQVISQCMDLVTSALLAWGETSVGLIHRHGAGKTLVYAIRKVHILKM